MIDAINFELTLLIGANLLKLREEMGFLGELIVILVMLFSILEF
ncbi:MAG: hypothetical protein ACJASQ_002264 [Crocinitomicaceae bacterium]|jgi:hypothetical protein